MNQPGITTTELEHPSDITPRKIGKLAEALPVMAPKVQTSVQLPVFATGAITATKLSRGILVICAEMRGVRQITAETEALPGIQIEARLIGRSFSKETSPPHRTAAIESDTLSINGFHKASPWNVEMPAQSAFEAVSISYPLSFLEDLDRMDKVLSARARELVDRRICCRQSMSLAQRLPFVKLQQLCLDPMGNKLRAEAIALELLADVIDTQNGAQDSSAEAQGLVEHAQKTIDAMLSDPPSIAELARLLRVSETRLKRTFSKATGQAVGAYMTQRRLEAAWDLVVMGLPLAKVANEIGYASPEAFSKAFRRHYGRSPSSARIARY